MSAVLSPIKLNQTQFNSPQKKVELPSGLGDEHDDTFSFKLTQVQPQNKKAFLPVRKDSTPNDLQSYLLEFDTFMKQQKQMLPKLLEEANTAEQRE